MEKSKARGWAKHLIAETRLKPHERRSLLLGNFTIDHPPIGFSIEINSEVLKSIVAQVRIQESVSGRKFISYITNNEDKPVSIKIWQL